MSLLQYFPTFVKSCIILSPVFTRESSYCFQRVLAIAILSVRPSVRLSVTRVDQSKRCKLESLNFHSRLPGRLCFRNRKAFP